jgi:hypothetical protein
MRRNSDSRMVGVVAIAFLCFLGGAVAASRWLPDLAPGPVAGVAFVVICGLSGAALTILGLNVDYLVRTLEEEAPHDLKVEAVTNVVTIVMRDCGSVLALALIAFLLAPRPPLYVSESDAEPPSA